MKLASLKNGTRDGALHVVSRDLRHAVSAASVALTLQAALDHWSDAEPGLQRLYKALNAGEAAGAIAFDATAAPYVRENPWHPSQTIAECAGGGIEIALRLNNLIDIERRILACGAHAEVLAPPELRETLRRVSAAMLARYPEEVEP